MTFTYNSKYSKVGNFNINETPPKTFRRGSEGVNDAIRILRKFGTNAHVYLPGAGVPVLGPELLTNGGFDSAGSWSVQSGVSIGTGRLNYASPATSTSTTQVNVMVIGKTYMITYTVISYTGTGAGFRVGAGSGAFGAARSAAGTYSDTLVCTTNTSLYVQGLGDNVVGSVDNVCVREITGYTNILNGLSAGNFIESTGITNGSVDNPVGLSLDALGSVGPELVPDVAFDTPSAWSFIQPTVGNVSVSSGGLDIVSTDGTFCSAYPSATVTITAGKSYRYVIVINSISGGQGVAVEVGAMAGSSHTSIGTHTGVIVATNSTKPTIKRGGATANSGGVIDSFSVKEVIGIHATQTTTANKPILRRGAVNLVTFSEDFTNAAWVGGATKLNATSFTLNGTVATTNRLQQFVPMKASTTVTMSFVASSSVAGPLKARISNGVDHTNGDPVFNITSTPTQFSTTFTLNSTTPSSSHIQFHTADAALGAATVTVTRVQFEVGSVATIYIPTTNTPKSAPTGPYFWEFDGVNDSLSFGAPLFQMTDDFAVVAGINVNSATYGQRIFSVKGTTSSIALLVASGTGQIGGEFVDDSGANSYPSVAGSAFGGKKVATLSKVGVSKKIRANGVSGAINTSVLGVTTNTSCAIGSIGTGGSFTNGSIYIIIAIKGTVSDSELAILEQFVGQLSGISL